MTTREIFLYPQHKKSLRTRSNPVPDVTMEVKQLVRDLKDSLHAHPEGIGLAAPQINIHKRVILVQVGSKGDENSVPGPPIALINPKITEANNVRKDFDGCLSFPGLYGETSRPHHLRVTGLDEDGKTFDRIFEGLDAIVVHHEIDHLNGVLFIDRIKSLEDLYTVRKNEYGELVQMPVTTSKPSG